MIVNWTPQALADLHAIEQVQARRSPRAAARLLARTHQLVGVLQQSPRFGPAVEDRDDPDLRELLLEKKYRILYRVHPDRVEVVAVVETWRRTPRGI